MLKDNPQEHLSDDELLQALVDVSDLKAERQSHLGQCADCQRHMDHLEQRFINLENKARQMAPAPPQPFRMPQKTEQQAWWFYRPMWAAGMVATMVLALVLWWPRQLERSAHIPDVARQHTVTDDSLFDQVDALVDNALPPIVQQLTASSELDESQSVIDWVVPHIDELDDDNSWT